MADTTQMRLSKVAKEFNLSISKIVEFLATKNCKVDNNPNAKIAEKEYALLQSMFSGDKSTKEAAQKISQNNLTAKREILVDTEKPATKPTSIIVENSSVIQAPKQIAEKKVEKAEVVETESIKDKVKLTGPKVLGSVEIAKKPIKKAAKSKDIEEDTEVITPKKAVKHTIQKAEPIAEQKPIVEAKPIPKAPEPPVEIFHETVYQKLEGPKLMGTIVLPIAREPKKTDENDALKRINGKRVRIKPGAVTQSEIKKVGLDQAEEAKKRAQIKYGSKANSKTTHHVREQKSALTDEEVQAQIKETLSRLSNKGVKSQSSKYRREKRDEVKDKMAKEQELSDIEKKTLRVTEFVSANQLAQMMNVTVTQIISTCMSLGLFVSINQRIDAETIAIVADEFGYKVEFVSAEIQESIVDQVEEDPKDLKERPPIVTIMGHVDHGKTSLLDFIRKSNVLAREAGGITQHIGSYNVKLDSGKSITFLDTPGHEAFTAMRARGTKVTDIAIIVIAADDSVMPQTKEAITHAQAANVPMIIAINKIDKPGANSNKIKEALSTMNILVEDWGGKVQCQEISAKTGLNIELLLEKIILESEMLELKANPNTKAVGTVIEAKLDKGKGHVADVIVQKGTLKIGDTIVAGCYSGNIKAMTNEHGQQVKQAGPSVPIQILGLNGAPAAGDTFNVMPDEQSARELANKRLQLQREQAIRTQKHITLDEVGRRLAIGDFKELNLIVKGDVDGSIEALSDSLLKLSTERIQVNIIHKAVGAISETDVMLASASNAIIVGFQVRPSSQARKLAEKEEIDIRLYSIIYDAINEIKAAMEGMLAPKLVEKIVCNIAIREVFNISKVGNIAGCYVLDGKVNRNTKVRVIRDGIVLHTGSLGSLKRFKDDVKEVSASYECGLNIADYNDIKIDDIIEGYDMVEVKAVL